MLPEVPPQLQAEMQKRNRARLDATRAFHAAVAAAHLRVAPPDAAVGRFVEAAGPGPDGVYTKPVRDDATFQQLEKLDSARGDANAHYYPYLREFERSPQAGAEALQREAEQLVGHD